MLLANSFLRPHLLGLLLLSPHPARQPTPLRRLHPRLPRRLLLFLPLLLTRLELQLRPAKDLFSPRSLADTARQRSVDRTAWTCRERGAGGHGCGAKRHGAGEGWAARYASGAVYARGGRAFGDGEGGEAFVAVGGGHGVTGCDGFDFWRLVLGSLRVRV